MIDNPHHRVLDRVMFYGLFLLGASGLGLLAYYGLCTTVFMTAPFLWLLTGPLALLLAAGLLLWLANSFNISYNNTRSFYKNKLLLLELFLLGIAIISSALGVYFFSASGLGFLFLCGPALALIFSLLAFTACIYIRIFSQEIDKLKIDVDLQLLLTQFSQPAAQFNRAPPQLLPAQRPPISTPPKISEPTPITRQSPTASELTLVSSGSLDDEKKPSDKEISNAIMEKLPENFDKLTLEGKVRIFIPTFKSLLKYATAYEAFRIKCDEQLQARGSVTLPVFSPTRSPAAPDRLLSPVDASPLSPSLLESKNASSKLKCSDCEKIQINTLESAIQGLVHLKTHAISLVDFYSSWKALLDEPANLPTSPIDPYASPPPASQSSPHTSSPNPFASPVTPRQALSFDSP